MTGPHYLFDTADPAERERLESHARLWDPFTFRKLEETGLGQGWRCLEIGAGTGTVAGWLVDRVGPTGQVVATDIETRWLERRTAANLVVRHHNVVADPLDDGFDLVHARLVLEHLPPRRAVAAKLAAALRPGGWLVVEDYDIRTFGFTRPELADWAAVNDAVAAAARQAGSDLHCGLELLDLLAEAGLEDVSAEGMVRLLPLPRLAPVFRPALEGLRSSLVDAGAVTEAQVDAALAAFDGGDPTVAYTPILVAAAGRRR